MDPLDDAAALLRILGSMVVARSMSLALFDKPMEGALGAGSVGGELVRGGLEADRVGEVALALESLVRVDMILFRMAV